VEEHLDMETQRADAAKRDGGQDPRRPWQTPQMRTFDARDAEMPVGKANPGPDGINGS
jgi:hypothetical protein